MKKFNIGGKDLALLILALLLALGIWLIHNLSFKYKEQVAVPVMASCNIDGHAGGATAAATLLVRCRASGFTLLGLNRRSAAAPVHVKFAPGDLKHKSGELFYITSSDLLDRYQIQIFGDGTEIEACLTDTLFFRFPYQNSRRVPVLSRIDVNFHPQFTALGPLSLSPDSVTVFGDPAITDAIECVYTYPLSIDDVSAPLHGSVHLEKPSGLRLSLEDVDYSMDVARYVEIVTEAKLSVKNVPAGRSLVVFPSVVRVLYRCRFPMSSVDALYPDLWIDYNDFKQSLSGKCLPRIEKLPGWVISYKVEPEVFQCVELEL